MNPQDKDYRAENRDENRKEKDESRKGKPEKSSRLGKEAKIGATVILLLLVTLAVVVVARLRGSGSDDKDPASIAGKDGERHKPHGAQDDPLFRDATSKSFSHHPPTVVTADTTPSKPPRSFDSGWNKGKQLPDRSEAKQAGSRYSPPISSPSFPSDPPKPPRPNRYDDVAADRTWDRDGAEQLRKTPNVLRPDSVEVKRPDRTTRPDSGSPVIARDDFDRTESSDRRGTSRYGDRSASLGPPTPAREPASFDDTARRSVRSTPISRYDDGVSRSPARSAYDRDDQPRYSGPSYGNRPPRRDDGKYEIQPNDNYSTISERCYGTNAYFKALAEHNRNKFANANYLHPGELISTPPVAELEKLYPDLCPNASRRDTMQSRVSPASMHGSHRSGRTYVVAEGDTLFNIARYELGKASRWAEIYELNRARLGKDFNYLTPGMELVLPDGEKSDLLTDRPRDTVR
jgi:nucleoid-associated protein YgaU